MKQLDFLDYEIPLLRVLVKLGGSARTVQVYPEIEKMTNLDLPCKPLLFLLLPKGEEGTNDEDWSGGGALFMRSRAEWGDFEGERKAKAESR